MGGMHSGNICPQKKKKIGLKFAREIIEQNQNFWNNALMDR